MSYARYQRRFVLENKIFRVCRTENKITLYDITNQKQIFICISKHLNNNSSYYTQGKQMYCRASIVLVEDLGQKTNDLKIDF